MKNESNSAGDPTPVKILILNGALSGKDGNTSLFLAQLSGLLRANGAQVAIRHLVQDKSPGRDELSEYQGFVFASGTYWDSWSSALQNFFETSTPLEGDACWFGKPAAVIVTMHSVGGKGILSRLQGVLNSFGLFVPPMSAMVYSLVNKLAAEAAITSGSRHADDMWGPEDLATIAFNLTTAARQQFKAKVNYRSWPVDRDDPKRVWLQDDST